MPRLNTAVWTLIVLCPFFFFSCSSNSKVKTKDQKMADLYYNHGTAALMKKDYTDALDKLLKAHQLRPNDTKIHNNLGMSYFFKRRHNEAKKHLLKSIQLDPKNSDAKVNLASLYFRQNQLGKAKELYLQVLNDLVYRHQYRTHYNLALINLRDNKRAEAKKNLMESITIRPEYCVSYFTLGQMAKQDYNYLEALRWFKKGTEGTCHNEAAPHYEQALTYLSLKKYEKAVLKFEDVAERFPKSKYSMMANMRLKNLNRSHYLTKKMKENIEIQRMKRSIEKSAGKLDAKKTELHNSPTF